MTLAHDIQTLTDDEAILLAWAELALATDHYLHTPKVPELISLTLSRLIDRLEPCGLRNTLQLALTTLRISVGESRQTQERRTH